MQKAVNFYVKTLIPFLAGEAQVRERASSTDAPANMLKIDIREVKNYRKQLYPALEHVS